jgi:hypothetical protein
MKRPSQFVRTLPLLLLIAPCLVVAGSRSVAPLREVSVRLYTATPIPPATLSLAIEQAQLLFRSAGLRIVIKQPAVEAHEDQGIDMTSAAFRQPTARPHLVLRLIAGMPAHVLPDSLGYALPYARIGAHAIIFYDRVDALSTSKGMPDYLILGYAITHELGHVLLSSREHSIGGVMQERWTAQTWRLASAGLLAFRPDEKQRMCLNVKPLQKH